MTESCATEMRDLLMTRLFSGGAAMSLEVLCLMVKHHLPKILSMGQVMS